jgi:hypothetical protein
MGPPSTLEYCEERSTIDHPFRRLGMALDLPGDTLLSRGKEQWAQ